MRRTWLSIPFVALFLGLAMAVAAGQGASSGGFSELHRATPSETSGVELVMGLIEREGESRSEKHQHPGGEFGFVLSGTVAVATESRPAGETLQAGDSFYQPPGEWHVVSTGAAGAKTVVFRVIEAGQPMVVRVE